jgi:hypothetical protein
LRRRYAPRNDGAGAIALHSDDLFGSAHKKMDCNVAMLLAMTRLGKSLLRMICSVAPRKTR